MRFLIEIAASVISQQSLIQFSLEWNVELIILTFSQYFHRVNNEKFMFCIEIGVFDKHRFIAIICEFIQYQFLGVNVKISRMQSYILCVLFAVYLNEGEKKSNNNLYNKSNE